MPVYYPPLSPTIGALDDIPDVDTTGVMDGDVLTYATGIWVAAPPTLPSHATSHEDGGTDEIDLAGLSGVPADLDDNGLPYVIDGGGAVVATGEKAGYVRIPFTGHIVGWTLLGDPAHTGSIVIDSWLDSYANFPPTVADSIWGGSKPTLLAADKAEATGLSIAVTKGQTIRHNVDSAATLWEATLNYHMTRS
jgi:hypothetical protein